MLQQPFRPLWSSVALSLMVAATAVAADNVLEVIPDNALGFVVVNHPETTQGKVMKLGEKLQLPIPDGLTLAKTQLGLDQGLAADARVALAGIPTPGPNSRPGAVLFLPVSDYELLLRSLKPTDQSDGIAQIEMAGQPSVIAHKAGYALVAQAGDRQVLQAVLESEKSVSGSLNTIQKWCDSMDVYAVGLPDGILLAQKGILTGLAAAKAEISQQENMGEAVIRGLEVYEKLFMSIDSELSQIAVGLQLDDEGNIHLASRTVFEPGGMLSEVCKQTQAPVDNPLSGLPLTPYVFAGGGVYPIEWTEELTAWSLDLATSYTDGKELTKEQITTFTKLASQSMRGMNSLAMQLGVNQPGQPLYSNMMLTLKVDDTKKYMANYEEIVRQMSKIGKDAEIPFLSYDISEIEVAGKPGLKLSIDMSKMYPQIPGADVQEKMLAMMFGEGGKLDVYLTAVDEHTVMGAYVSPHALETAISQQQAGTFKSLADEPAVQRVSQLLLDQPHGVGFWSIGGTMNFIRQTIATVVPNVPVNIPTIPDTDPLGLAIKVSPEGMETDMVISIETSKTIAEFVKQVVTPPNVAAESDGSL